MKSENDFKESAPLGRDFSLLYRAVGLLLVGLGSLVVGSTSIPPESFTSIIDSLSYGVVVGAVTFLCGIGVIAGGFAGLLIFSIGNAILGLLFFGSVMPVWVSTIGFASIMAGAGLRIFNPV